MTVDPKLDLLGRQASHRRTAIVALVAIPLALAATFVAALTIGATAAIACAVLGLVIVIAAIAHARRSTNDAWLARRLDALDARFEDSADLLFRDDGLTSLQRLQRARLERRLDARAQTDIVPRWPRHVFAVAWFAAAVAIVAAAFEPRIGAHGADASATASPGNGATTIERVAVAIAAPDYTRLSARNETSLDLRVAEGARATWTLDFSSQPAHAALVFHDGSRVELARGGDGWRGGRTLDRSALYRVVVDGASALDDERLHRVDVIADRAPDVRVIEPDKSLTLLADGQREWNLAFEASDDYGIASANLTVTLAQGTGENIAFKEQTIALAGDDIDPANSARTLRFRHTLDLGALGIARGDDVIVRLAVADNRTPQPNTTRTASFILRWPPEASDDSVGMEGLVEKTLPAYFRSQRQIIIDTEALIADAPALEDHKVLARSDGIGVDQKILRLRYGQFLGEESETRSEAESPAAADAARAKDAADAGRADALTRREKEHQHGREIEKFGDAGAVTSEYGHVHDVAEAATLIDPDTKKILVSALNEMWQAELHLRQGRPIEALPFENNALAYIKEVQQSSRIYLARVGLELPSVDEKRRLSGDRKGVTDRTSALIPASTDDSGALAIWQTLDAGGLPEFDAFERWLHAHENRVGDSLAVLAADDRVRREPACVECRDRLRALLWPLLPKPATRVRLRDEADATGRAYLDALGAGRAKESAR